MEIIVLGIIVIILAIVLFFALKRLIASINNDNKDYYLKIMAGYDDEIIQKSKELDLMKNAYVNNPVNEENKEEKTNIEIDKNLLDIMNSTDYSSDNALKVANRVDDIFNVDEEKIIKDFLKKAKFDKAYKTYQSLYDRFSPNLIYKLKMLDRDTQIKEIGKLIPDDEFEIFDSYIKSHKFKLNRFLLDLDQLIERTRPNIEILVGSKNKNYDNLSPYIKTIYDDDIYKGIIIKYQDQIYDYSINERDV